MRVYCASRKEDLETATEPLGPRSRGQVFLLPSVPGIVAKIFFESRGGQSPRQGRNTRRPPVR